MEASRENTNEREDAVTYVGQYDPLKLLTSILDRLVRLDVLSREQADAALKQARSEMRDVRRPRPRQAPKRSGPS